MSHLNPASSPAIDDHIGVDVTQYVPPGGFHVPARGVQLDSMADTRLLEQNPYAGIGPTVGKVLIVCPVSLINVRRTTCSHSVRDLRLMGA